MKISELYDVYIDWKTIKIGKQTWLTFSNPSPPPLIYFFFPIV